MVWQRRQMEASGNNRSCLLSSPTTLSRKRRGRKEEAAFIPEAVWYRHKSHLLASVKSEALQVAGRLSSSVPGGCAGSGSPCLMTIGSSVHQDQAITNSKSNHYLHLYYHPNSDTYPIGLDIESSMSMFSMNAEQNGACCHKLVIPSGDRDKCKLGLILVTKWVCFKHRKKEHKTVI